MDAIDLILECHDRIRRYTGGLTALADAPDLGEQRCRNTAEQCARYLRQGLLLHAADEDLSLLPRLEHVPQLATAMDTLAHEHEIIEAQLPAVLADLDRIAAGRAPEPGFPARAQAFSALLLQHIEEEERNIFPVARRHLPDDQHDAIVAEVRGRRQGP